MRFDRFWEKQCVYRHKKVNRVVKFPHWIQICEKRCVFHKRNDNPASVESYYMATNDSLKSHVCATQTRKESKIVMC